MTIWTPRIDPHARAKFSGIADALMEDVCLGVLRAGDALPPQRVIANALGVDLTTVTRAINEARARGLISARRGSGTAIAEGAELAAGDFLGKKPAAVAPLLDMSMNIPPQPEGMILGRDIANTITTLMKSQRGTLHMGYRDSIGSEPDRRAALLWLRQSFKNNADMVRYEHVALAPGSQAALAAIFDAALNRGAKICAGDVTYPGFKALADARGMSVLPLQMDKDGIIPESFAAACRAHQPEAIYVIPSIDNPTTTTLPESRRREIAAIAQKHNVMIIEDDAYGMLLPTPLTPIACFAPERSWYIATLAKCLTPALRLAYVMAPDAPSLQHLGASLRVTAQMSSPLLSAVVSQWINDGTVDGIVKSIRAESTARQALARTILHDTNYMAHPQGHHIWLPLPQPWTAQNFCAQASRAGLAVVPAQAFSLSPRSPVEAVRISLGAAPSRNVLEQWLQVLNEQLNGTPQTLRAVV